MNKLLIIKLLVSIALPLGIGAFAGIFTSQSIPEWYATSISPHSIPQLDFWPNVVSSLYIDGYFLLSDMETTTQQPTESGYFVFRPPIGTQL